MENFNIRRYLNPLNHIELTDLLTTYDRATGHSTLRHARPELWLNDDISISLGKEGQVSEKIREICYRDASVRIFYHLDDATPRWIYYIHFLGEPKYLATWDYSVVGYVSAHFIYAIWLLSHNPHAFPCKLTREGRQHLF